MELDLIGAKTTQDHENQKLCYTQVAISSQLNELSISQSSFFLTDTQTDWMTWPEYSWLQ